MPRYKMYLYEYADIIIYESYESDSVQELMDYAIETQPWYAQLFDGQNTVAEWTGTHWEFEEGEVE